MYPTGSFPRKFFGTARLHELPMNGVIHDLPIWPIVSNIRTASYYFGKYLSKVLSSMAYSQYIIRTTTDLIDNVKNERIPREFRMVSIDVKSLFTSLKTLCR